MAIVILALAVSGCAYMTLFPRSSTTLLRQVTLSPLKISVLANTSNKTYQRISMEFIRKYGLDWIHVMDSDMSVFEKYDVRGTPT